VPDPSTTRLALYKSKSDGSELASYTQDIGQNLDKLDAAAGFQVVTSSTRPSSPYSGKPIAQSDTSYSTYFSNGTAPASASWVEIPNSSGTFNNNLKISQGKQINFGASGSNAYVAVLTSTSTDDILATRVTGDTVSRFLLEADGTQSWSPGGSTAADTFLARGAANRLDLTTADFRIATAGRGLRVAEGSNAKMGTAVLVAGTVVVSNTSVTANSRIFLTCQTPGGTPGFLRVSARTAATSFTILSSSGTDTSTVGWMIVEPG
jgi:hypothetical protein